MIPSIVIKPEYLKKVDEISITPTLEGGIRITLYHTIKNCHKHSVSFTPKQIEDLNMKDSELWDFLFKEMFIAFDIYLRDRS